MTSVDFDDILPKIGRFGEWQKLCVALLWLPPMFAGIHNLLFVFTGVETFKLLELVVCCL